MGDVVQENAVTSAQPMTFSGMWDAAVAARPDAPFLVFEAPDEGVTEWSYKEFDRVAAQMSQMLWTCGVRSGSAVHLALTNGPTFVAVWLGALRLGAWIVPSDPLSTAAELAEHLKRTRAIVSIASLARSAEAERAVTSVSAARLHDDPNSSGPMLVLLNDHDLSDLPLTDPTVTVPDAIEPAATDLAAVMFTSGTTSQPKGVEITQANYAFAGSTMAAAAGLTAHDRQLVVLPLFHANAQYYSFAAAIAVGASVALIHSFSARGFVRQAARHRATHASLFASPIRMILARGAPLSDLDRAAGLELVLRHCWFAQNLDAQQYEMFSDWLGCRPRQLYGMTETIAAVLSDSHDAPQPDTMGFVTPGCEVKIHDELGRPCPPGIEGEILVSGTRGHELFAGYLNDPDVTAASFSDGWFHTGDRATCDADGRFRFAGRRSDVLKVSGENVSTVEVEAAITEHPDVLEAVVIGVHDPIRDQVPVAFVVPTNETVDISALPAALEVWATERLSKSKRPTSYTVVTDVPRTSVGKVRKFLLTAELPGRTTQ